MRRSVTQQNSEMICQIIEYPKKIFRNFFVLFKKAFSYIIVFRRVCCLVLASAVFCLHLVCWVFSKSLKLQPTNQHRQIWDFGNKTKYLSSSSRVSYCVCFLSIALQCVHNMENTQIYKGSNFFRQRLILSVLSGKPIIIKNIRDASDEPGIKGIIFAYYFRSYFTLFHKFLNFYQKFSFICLNLKCSYQFIKFLQT